MESSVGISVLQLPRYSDGEATVHTVNVFLPLAESIYWKRGTRCGRTFPLHWEPWILLLQHHILPMQSSTQPLCIFTPLRIPVGLKQCIHLMFYLCAVMKFLYQLGRCDESFMSWVPETLLGYVLAQCLYLSQRKHPRAWMSFIGEDGTVKLHLCFICIVCHLQNTLIHQSGPALRSWTKLQPNKNSQCWGVCQPLIWVNFGALLGSAAGGVCFVLFGIWKEASPAIPCLSGLILTNRAEPLLTVLYRYTGWNNITATSEAFCGS